MNRATRISEHMTKSPHFVGQGQSLASAAQRMRAHKIRHLPVLEGNRLVGIVSDRDVAVVSGLSSLDPETVTIEEVMFPEPYCVPPSALLLDVVREMERQKLGSVVVMDGTEVVGIFTTTDALRLLGRALDVD